MPDKDTIWTEEQLKAINHRNSGAIVSAAAGSGKTATLVERVINMITDEENVVFADKIAIVTFTEKAAGELRQRFSRELNKRLCKNPDSSFLQNQLIRLQDAKISTISAFCFDILRENIQLSPLSAGFTILDETQAKILRDNALEQAIDLFYENGAKEQVKLVVDWYNCVSNDQLKDSVNALYLFTRNLPDYKSWLKKQYEEYSATAPFAEIKKDGFEKLKATIRKLTDKNKELYRLSKGQTAKFQSYAEEINNAVSPLEALLDMTMEEFCAGENKALLARLTTGVSLPRKLAPTIDKAEMTALRDFVVDTYKQMPLRINNFLEFDNDISACKPAITALIDICCEYEKIYQSIKRDRNSADFSDAEQVCLELLCKDGKPTALAENISENYEFIIVDEFQDSNRVQYEIFKMISRDEKNLYFVGDIKQSIYGFRGADPRVFSEICNNNSYTFLPMNKNFRSRKDVVKTINGIFTGMMTKNIGGVDYDSSCELVYGANYSQREDIPTEICLVDGDTCEEAEYVAQRISELLDSGFVVNDRPCKYGDFAILLRSGMDKAKVFGDALKKRSIPVDCGDEKDYLGLQEITLILNLLTVIDNPYHEKELLAILLSPLYMFDSDMLAQIKMGLLGVDIEQCDSTEELISENRTKPLFSCIKSFCKPYSINNYTRPANEKCISFVEEIDRLRNYMASNSVEKLIQKIYDSTDFLWVMSLYEYGDRKVANLRKLLTYVKGFEQSGGGILGDFLAYIDKLVATKNDLAQAKQINKNGNCVRIMTIHSSKGLEFPICFVSDCDKKFNDKDLQNDMFFDAEIGIAAKVVNRKTMTKYPTMLHDIIKQKKKEQLAGEEMRLLYVAATRARERLFFTGCYKGGILKYYKDYKPDTVFLCEEQLLTSGVGISTSYLKWILLRLKIMDNFTEVPDECKDQRFFLDMNIVLRNAIIFNEESKQQEINEDITPDFDTIEKIRSNIDFIYPNLAKTKISAKFTATEIAKNKRLLDENTDNCGLYVRKPSFLTEKTGKLSGKQRGDAYHKVMELVDVGKISETEITAQLNQLATKQFISVEELQCVNPAHISGFFTSDLGKRVLSADKLFREYPIFHRLDMSKINKSELGIETDSDFSDIKPLVQGIVDMFFIEKDHIVLVDYKTDSFADKAQLVADYGRQLEIYKQALESMFGMPVLESYIYSFKLGEAILL